MADGAGQVALPKLSSSGLSHSRDGLSGLQTAAGALVPGDMADDQLEAWHERPGVAADAGAGQLQDGVGDAAQTAASNGASRGKLFYRLAQQAVQVELAPFDSLVTRKG